MIKIIIPTLGRIDRQITYKSFPEKYQKIITFVVQAHEYDEMIKRYPKEQVMKLPDHIKTIAPTREYIHNKFKEHRYAVFDDDLRFIIKDMYYIDGDAKFKNTKMNEDDFDDMFNLINSWMDEGYVHCSLQPNTIIPSEKYYPTSDNGRIWTNVFYDGPNLPDNIDWLRVPHAEDFDVNLQLLTAGYKNRLSTRYRANCGATNKKGGCSNYRTLEKHNESMEKLAELWPDFVKLREEEVKSNNWEGLTKKATIYFSKAYKSSQNKKESKLNPFIE